MQALPDPGCDSSIQATVPGHVLGSLIDQIHGPATETAEIPGE